MNKLILVADVMWKNVDIVHNMDTVAEALSKMEYKKTKLLVVEKGHEHDEYGVVLISDIAREVIAKDRAPERVNIYEIMHKPVLSVHSKMDVRYCAGLLSQFNLSRCPVIDDGRVVGVVSLTNIVLNGLRV